MSEEFESTEDRTDEFHENGDNQESSMEGDYIGEEKKPVNQNTLVGGAILAVVVGLTYFMMLKSGPQAASAESTIAVDADGQTISGFLGGADNNIHLMETMLQKTANVVARFRTYSDTKQIPLASLQTNPFHFARVETKRADLDEEAAKRAREDQVQDALASAGQLRLQSILIGGSRKSCIIDGKAFAEGDKIGKFEIAEIRQRTVILGESGLRLEISMVPAPSAGN
ncbi:MAG: hypothetical protein M3O30_01935 [Planctomycetota bacterium]|nr:hypothetical protein [Planctomycetota bacterium]